MKKWSFETIGASQVETCSGPNKGIQERTEERQLVNISVVCTK